MASLPSIPQVTGAQLGAYESLWRQADVSGSGRVDGGAAARFLKKSGLQEGVLHQIWNLSDCYGRGYLDKQGFVVALKFIALAQAAMPLTTANLSFPTGLPVLTESRDISPPSWAIGTADKQKYDNIFQNLGPVGDKLSGPVVQQVMRNSKLPNDSLAKIWDMSDIDEDGQMDSDEFAVAMHLIYQTLDGQQIPSSLPQNLVPPSKLWKLKKSPSPPTSVSPSTSTGSLQHASGQSRRKTSKSPSPAVVNRSGSGSQLSPTVAWIVSPTDKTRYDGYFNRDKAADGFISGDDARKVFLQSGLPNIVLGKIWELCDIDKSGKLNSEEFALAMHMISNALKGVDPPAVLTADMMPPSRRHSKTDSVSSGADPSMMKELDQLSRDIEVLGREKVSLDDELQKREESVRQKSAEALQVELDTSSSNLKDLENLKASSKSRVDQMDEERAKYEEMVAEVKQKCKDEEDQIARLKAQLANQEVSTKVQEEELSKAQDELRSLQNDKKQLLQEIEASKVQLDSVIQQISATQTEMTQVRSRLAELHSTQRSITAALAQYSSLAGGSAGQPLPMDLTKLAEPVDDALSARATAGSSPVSTLSAFSNGSMADKDTDRTDDFKDDPFKTATEQFGVTEDPFNSDPFKRGDSGFSDPFGGDPFKNDPFKSDDPFQVTQTTTKVTFSSSTAPSRDFSDFDPFTSQPFKSQHTTESSSSDPFAIFGTEPAASVGSSDAQPPKLPPKRSAGGPSRQATTGAAVDVFGSSFGGAQSTTKSSTFNSDPFGGGRGFGGAGGGFANFGSFPGSTSQSKSATIPATFGVSSSQIDKNLSDDDMVAWVKAESLREEKERQRQQQQVEAEEEQQFKLALQESVRGSSNA
ncbi:epidermal growth factor receptor substrate 15-like 1 isoform X2 [Corticium candelabrum]|uniref:epidermal growth factor receptor substrate 15-like 1 isoform X2 n=1 Tax=Corticium candelabrum TaxID=121492 RepID=UPI002E252A29|nr:epidermal growth factor receptor substrate 15-like 1 isoform X2 [Corticium candelabrum]